MQGTTTNRVLGCCKSATINRVLRGCFKGVTVTPKLLPPFFVSSTMAAIIDHLNRTASLPISRDALPSVGVHPTLKTSTTLYKYIQPTLRAAQKYWYCLKINHGAFFFLRLSCNRFPKSTDAETRRDGASALLQVLKTYQYRFHFFLPYFE